ncbi:DUF2970 domain-containing protein [Aquitalea pelogenes]|nr:DUF2970 domain-containing protein [Aquitalea pelogenes]
MRHPRRPGRPWQLIITALLLVLMLIGLLLALARWIGA